MSFSISFGSECSSVRDCLSHSNFFKPDSKYTPLTTPPLKDLKVFNSNYGYGQRVKDLSYSNCTSSFRCNTFLEASLFNPFCLYPVTNNVLVDGSIFKPVHPHLNILCQIYSFVSTFAGSFGCHLPTPQHSLLNINKVLFQSCNFHYGGYAI